MVVVIHALDVQVHVVERALVDAKDVVTLARDYVKDALEAVRDLVQVVVVVVAPILALIVNLLLIASIGKFIHTNGGNCSKKVQSNGKNGDVYRNKGLST